ncbi:MAG: Mur ligase family protein [Planctomycetota bacterium]
MQGRLPPLEGCRVTVMGLGRHGGGLGVAAWLGAQGADVLVTDLAGEDALQTPLDELHKRFPAAEPPRLRLGEHNISDFTDTDLVIANPAVPKPWDNRYLRAASAAKVPVTTEIGLVASHLLDRKRVVGVTGSAGKSTTASMIEAGLTASGIPTLLGGNIGGSLLDRLDQANDTTIVLELSSAMLYWLKGWSPGIAVVTSFEPNHLDWHGDLDHYLRCKQSILASQTPSDYAVLEQSLDWPVPDGVRVVKPGNPIDGLTVVGAHNRNNAALALAACVAAAPNASRDDLASGIRAFKGLPHRLSTAGTFRGVRCIDDSKSTTPSASRLACAAASEELANGRLLLIAGGYDKHVSLDELRDLPGSPEVFAIGQTGAEVARVTGGTVAGTLEHAVELAAQRARPGDVLLLSPACASWDQFTGFEERGLRFTKLVQEQFREDA